MEAFDKPQEFGPYLIHSRIAKGGMADVLLATSGLEQFEGQFLAIKKLLPNLNANKPFVNLLIHEAKIGVLLTHPCIVQVFDLGNYNAEFFLVMEYVHGKSLEALLAKLRAEPQIKLSPELCTFLISEVLRALAFAHQLKDSKERDLSIIHRDITPGNILLSYSGDVKLADFGIATAENRLQPGFTQKAMGKVSYISPEQAVNYPATIASDIYSLGVVYYQLLSGRLPFEGANAQEVFKKIIDGKMNRLSEVAPHLPPKLCELVERCLSRAPENRPQTCPEFYSELHQYFLVEYQVDFSAKATRNYYKKKLSEFLQSKFTQEIQSDLEIIQSALAPIHTTGVKDTGPHSFDEATVFDPDLTDDATHHLDALEISGHPEKSEPIEFESPRTELHSFSVSRPSAKQLSVEARLTHSSLTRDEKEQLSDLKPQLEIASEEDLEKFEYETFVGPSTNPKRDSLANSKANTIPAEAPSKPVFGVITKPAFQSKSEPNQKAKTSPPIPASEQPSKSKLITWVSISVFFFVLALGMLGAFFFRQYQNSKPVGSMVPTQKIQIQLLGEAPQELLQTLLTSIGDRQINPNLKQVEDFFNHEFTRYTGNSKILVELSVNGYPVSIADGLSRQTNYEQLFSSDLIFSFLEDRGFSTNHNSDSMVFVYLFPQLDDQPTQWSFPQEFNGPRSHHRGIIFNYAHPMARLSILKGIAREIATIYGATDKRHRETLMPAFPEGFAEPKKKPLFPQSKAELMGAEIPVNPLQRRPIESLNDLVIGPETAYELGWISKTQKDKLIK